MRMGRLEVPLLAVLVVAGCSLGYGARQNHSEFTSVRLADDGRTVWFGFNALFYRPAAGWRAFPDGGVPKYEVDRNVLGTYDVVTHETRILQRGKNTRWQPGQGRFAIVAAAGRKALVSQGGQRRGPFRFDYVYLLADFGTGRVESFDLKRDLERHGRAIGQIEMVDGAGTLVLITTAPDPSGSGPRRKRDGAIPELWVRTPAGGYVEVAATANYEGTRNGEVVYWVPDTRMHMAFDIRTGNTRQAPEYRVPEPPSVTTGVNLASDRKALEFGVRDSAGSWSYEPLGLKARALE